METRAQALQMPVIPAKAGIQVFGNGASWERGRPARFAMWRASGPPAGETPALPGSRQAFGSGYAGSG